MVKTLRDTISYKKWIDGLVQRLNKFKEKRGREELKDLKKWILAGLILARCALFGHKYVMIGGLWSGDMHFYCSHCSREVGVKTDV